MPAFLSSDQLRELHGPKPIIELDVVGFGLVTVDENISCGYCKEKGSATMPEGVTGCLYCQRMEGGSYLEFEQLEGFQEVLRAVPAMLLQAKEHYRKRFGPKPRNGSKSDSRKGTRATIKDPEEK